jgi:hypothetical protein
MKYLNLVVFSVMLLLSGCGDSEEEILQKAKEIEFVRASEKENPITVKKENVVSFYKNGFNEGVPRERVRIIELYGCEYVLYEKEIGTRWGVAGLAHKGNCEKCMGIVYNEKRK